MSDSFEALVQRARYIGVDQIAYPIDIFSLATDIADHVDSRRNIKRLFPLINDPENYFTRWTAIRAIRQMGPVAIRRAKSQLTDQLKHEDYEQTQKEIEDALAQLENDAT